MEKAKIDSPRGTFTLSKSHDPVQDIYLRKVEGTQNKYVGRGGEGAGRSVARLQDVGSPAVLRCTHDRRPPAEAAPRPALHFDGARF